MEAKQSDWWNSRWFVALALCLAAAPLLWPDIPPLTDLPGHMGRYHIQLELAGNEGLQRFYEFEWALIGNLGVDLLIVPLAPIFGLELAVKLIVIAIPVLTVGGLLLVARELHGEIPPTAIFALPLAYNFPFLFGFVNFALSMALALLAFALWLRLARRNRFAFRAVIFVPISLLLWLTHVYGWAFFGILAFAAEFARAGERGRAFFANGMAAAVQCLALLPPLVLMALWRGDGAAGETGGWLELQSKVQWMLMALRDRWQLFDLASLFLLIALPLLAWRRPELGFARSLGLAALFLLAAFILLPRVLIGSAFADMRLFPFALAIAIIAIGAKQENRKLSHLLAIAGLCFFLVRTGGAAASFLLYDRDYDRQLAALDHVPEGARIVALVGTGCAQPWALHRREHLPAMAIARRDAFANDQWQLAGAQLLRVRYDAAAPFVSDPSQIVTPNECDTGIWATIDGALARIPRDTVDFLWLIGTPEHNPGLTRPYRRVWSDGNSALYAVD